MKIVNKTVSPVLWQLLLAASATLLYWRWVGYQGGDDISYARAGLALAEDFGTIGKDHWSLRYPVILPVAVAFLSFKQWLYAPVMPTLLAFIGLMTATTVFLVRRFGSLAGFLYVLIGVMTPSLLIQATWISADMMELAFVSFSFVLFLAARRSSGAVTQLLLSGAAAGVAFLTRETSAALLLFFGLMFLVRPGFSRWRYFIMAAGFFAILGAQLGYFAAKTGDPLYRFRLSALHDQVDRTAEFSRMRQAGSAVDREGTLSINPWLDPILLLFTNHYFGLLFFVLIPALILMARQPRGSPEQIDAVWCFATLGLVWFVFVAANASILYVAARYYMVCVWTAVALVAIAAARFIDRPLIVLGLLALLGVGFAMLYLENVEPLYPERELRAVADRTIGPISTDPRTLRRASIYLRYIDAPNRVTSTPPTSGSTVFVRDRLMEDCSATPICNPTQVQDFEPRPEWVLVERKDGPRRFLGDVLRVTGLAAGIHPQILRKIEQPNPGWSLYRVP